MSIVYVYGEIVAMKNKLRISKANDNSVLLYGSKTWKVTKDQMATDFYINRCLRYIMRI